MRSESLAHERLSSVRSRTGALVLLLAANFVLRASVAVRPLETIDWLTIPDDAYLSLHLARSIARGIGPFYGTAVTNGFQPLYVFLCVPAFWLFPNDPVMPVHFALLLFSIFDTATLYFLFRIIRQEVSHPTSPFIAGIAWIPSSYVPRTTLNGLETMIASCFILALFYYYRAHVSATWVRVPVGRWCMRGLLAGMSIVARIDSTFFVVIILLLVFSSIRRTKEYSALLPVLGCALFVLLPWFLYSYHYTGCLYPVSGTAVRFLAQSYAPAEPTLLNWYFPALGRAMITIGRENWRPGVLLLLLILLTTARKPDARQILDRIGMIIPMALFVLILAVVYPLYVPAAWFYPRYLFPSFLLTVILVGTLSDVLFGLMANPRLRISTALGLGVSAIMLSVLDTDLAALYTSATEGISGHRVVGP